MGIPKITQENVHIFIPHKVSEIAEMIAEDEHISQIDALRKFYHSNTYKQLEDEATKLWYESAFGLYKYYLLKK